jgi:hypothetical protein
VAAGLLLAGCGATQAAAPVTSTVTAVQRTTVTHTSLATVVSTPPAETVTTTASATGLAAIPSDTLTCASLTGIYNVLSKMYVESFQTELPSYTNARFVAFGQAVDMTAQTLSITKTRLQDVTAAAAWDTAIQDAQAASKALEGEDGAAIANTLTTFITAATQAMSSCTAVMGG